MKTILTILAIMVVSVIFAQTPKRMVVIPDYTLEQEIKLNERIQQDYVNSPTYVSPYRVSYSRDIFVLGNFNTVNVVRPMMEMPKCIPENNNYEYIKTTQFNPNKSLQEILRNDKP